MAQKDFTGRGVDIFDDIALSLDATSKRVVRRENDTRPVVPRYRIATGIEGNGDFPLNPIEGQVAVGIDDNNLWYYVNGRWRSGVAGSWIDFELEPPWFAVAPFHMPPQYMILAQEYFFRGAITGGTDTDLVATLPVDDRPEFFHRYLISRDYQVAFIEIDTDGTVYMKSSV